MQPVPPPATACGRDAQLQRRGALADAAAAAGLAPRLLPGRDGPGHREELGGRAAAALSGHGACSRFPAPGAPPPPAAFARWVRARAWGHPGRAGWGAPAAGTWDDRPRAGGARGVPEPAAPRGGSRCPGPRADQAGSEAPGSRWLPFGSRPGTGGSVRFPRGQGAPSVSLPRAPPRSVCREVLSPGGGEGG